MGPKSSYEDKMVDCMEKCTRSSHGLVFSHLHFDHCVHHCEKKCNKPTYPHHPVDPYKPTYPHHSVDPYKPDHSYHPEEYSHEHNGPKHRSCLGNCIDICDEDSSLGRMSQGFKLKALKKKKLLKAKVLKKKLLKKVLLKKLLKKKLLKKALLKKLIKKKLLWEPAQINSTIQTIKWVLTPIRTRRTQDSQTQHVVDLLKVTERDQEVWEIVREEEAEFQPNVVLAA